MNWRRLAGDKGGSTENRGEAVCSEPKRLKSGTSEPGPTVRPLGPGQALPPLQPAAVDDMMLEIQRDEQVQAQLEEQPIFTTGEIILVKGALWKVKAITEKRLYLDVVGIK